LLIDGVAFEFFTRRSIMNYISIAEAAKKWGITPRRIQVLCAGERIPGASRLGNAWAIPKDAKKPIDARVKSGKYIKKP
jgi:hypothetical protein